MVLFFNLLDVSTVAARVIFGIKHPQDALAKADTRGDFIREIAKDKMAPLILRRQQTNKRASRQLKELWSVCLKSCGIAVQVVPPPVRNAPPAAGGAWKRGRCGLCPWKSDKKGASQCTKCASFLCKEHCIPVCKNCL